MAAHSAVIRDSRIFLRCCGQGATQQLLVLLPLRMPRRGRSLAGRRHRGRRIKRAQAVAGWPDLQITTQERKIQRAMRVFVPRRRHGESNHPRAPSARRSRPVFAWRRMASGAAIAGPIFQWGGARRTLPSPVADHLRRAFAGKHLPVAVRFPGLKKTRSFAARLGTTLQRTRTTRENCWEIRGQEDLELPQLLCVGVTVVTTSTVWGIDQAVVACMSSGCTSSAAPARLNRSVGKEPRLAGPIPRGNAVAGVGIQQGPIVGQQDRSPFGIGNGNAGGRFDDWPAGPSSNPKPGRQSFFPCGCRIPRKAPVSKENCFPSAQRPAWTGRGAPALPRRCQFQERPVAQSGIEPAASVPRKEIPAGRSRGRFPSTGINVLTSIADHLTRPPPGVQRSSLTSWRRDLGFCLRLLVGSTFLSDLAARVGAPFNRRDAHAVTGPADVVFLQTRPCKSAG